MEYIPVLKNETVKQINKLIRDRQGGFSFFVCTSNDDAKNNGYNDTIKCVNFNDYNVIIIR